MSSDLLALLPPDAEERLREIATSRGDDPDDPDYARWVATDVLDFPRDGWYRATVAGLLVLLIQQARENAALRPLLEHPPTFRDYTGTDERTCGYCHAPLEGYSRGKDEHEPTCPWSVARARLLATPEPAADG